MLLMEMNTITDSVITLADATEDQLEMFHTMEKDNATLPYIISYSIERHRQEFKRNDTVYKSVYDAQGALVGFVILILDPDGCSVEFARIVIAQKGRSYGSRAVALIDQVCRDELGRRRVWLDVFEFNPRAQHVYESWGYQFFGTRDYQGKILRLYEKEV